MGVILSRKLTKSKYIRYLNLFNKVTKDGSGRFGVVKVGYKGFIEFREIAQSTDGLGRKWIKIDILDIFPGNNYSKSEILEEIKGGPWIAENINCSSAYDYYISWFDDNSQRMRDEKIKQILSENLQ